MSVNYDRIKQLCEEHGITIAELERELGFSNSTIRKWGQGISPSIDKIVKVANRFDVSVDYLIGMSDVRGSVAEIIKDRDIISLQRARENMSDVDKERMMQMLRLAFYHAFEDDDKI